MYHAYRIFLKDLKEHYSSLRFLPRTSAMAMKASANPA